MAKGKAKVQIKEESSPDKKELKGKGKKQVEEK